MARIFIATKNKGKLRDFAAAAAEHGVEVECVPGLDSMPPAKEDGPTFESNACKKAEYYSRSVKDELVLADDSGLEVMALGSAPGVHSARYSAIKAGTAAANSSDAENNARLLDEMRDIPDDHRDAEFVCNIAVARNGRLVALFRGEVDGMILHQSRGTGGFGYDPVFFIPALNKTFAELTPEEKSGISHRGQAFRKFLAWYEQQNHASSAKRG
jgi:XTP/dITP diphosphohydrolase